MRTAASYRKYHTGWPVGKPEHRLPTVNVKVAAYGGAAQNVLPEMGTAIRLIRTENELLEWLDV
jgi:hypothetical protein